MGRVVSEEVCFPSCGQRVLGTLLTPANANGSYGIMVHGLYSDRNGYGDKYVTLGDYFCRKGVAALRFDARGHAGQSDSAVPTVSNAKDDVVGAVRFVKDRGARRIVMLGSSYGGIGLLYAIAEMIEAGENCIAAVITVSTPSKLTPVRLSYLNEDVRRIVAEDIARYDLKRLAALRGKVPHLAFHGERDDVLPPSERDVYEITAQTGGRAVIVRNADHTFTNRAAIRAMTTGWKFFAENLLQ